MTLQQHTFVTVTQWPSWSYSLPEGVALKIDSEFGLDFSGFSTQATFLDYDRDGDLDVYLLNHAIHTVRSYGTSDKRVESDSLSGDKFYENKVNEIEGRFVEVTRKVNIYDSPLGYGLAITASDINDDGWLDVYVGNDFHEHDYIYINNKDKPFSESIKKSIYHKIIDFYFCSNFNRKTNKHYKHKNI